MDWREEQQKLDEVRIAQKVGAAHRDAFKQKFPGQCEHILRLIAERLQLGLRKDQPVELSNSEVADLAQALQHIYNIHTHLESR